MATVNMAFLSVVMFIGLSFCFSGGWVLNIVVRKKQAPLLAVSAALFYIGWHVNDYAITGILMKLQEAGIWPR